LADRYCGNCGQQFSPENRFCPNCGRPVHETAHVPTPEADLLVPPPPEPPVAEEPVAEEPVAEEPVGEPVASSRWGARALAVESAVNSIV
jgi:hypothetical protein